jgi:hypothetical protein
VRVTIAAADLPELWEEYVGEIDSDFFEWYARYFTLEEMIEQITNWLFGGKEEEDEKI